MWMCEGGDAQQAENPISTPKSQQASHLQLHSLLIHSHMSPSPSPLQNRCHTNTTLPKKIKSVRRFAHTFLSFTSRQPLCFTVTDDLEQHTASDFIVSAALLTSSELRVKKKRDTMCQNAIKTMTAHLVSRILSQNIWKSNSFCIISIIMI